MTPAGREGIATCTVLGLSSLMMVRDAVRPGAFLDHLKDAFPRWTPDELAAYIGD